MFKNLKRDIVVFALALGSFCILYEGYYYLQVLRWVDAIRIQSAIAEASKHAPPTPTQP